MKHVNEVYLAGPLSHVKRNDFEGGNWALTANVSGVRVQMFSYGKDDQATEAARLANEAQSAVVMGSMDGKPDKKDPNKFWYNVSVRPAGFIPSRLAHPALNIAVVSGEVRYAQNQWLLLASRYKIGKTNSWGESLIWALASQPVEGYNGQTLLITGAIRPKVDAEWRLHVVAENILRIA